MFFPERDISHHDCDVRKLPLVVVASTLIALASLLCLRPVPGLSTRVFTFLPPNVFTNAHARSDLKANFGGGEEVGKLLEALPTPRKEKNKMSLQEKS